MSLCYESSVDETLQMRLRRETAALHETVERSLNLTRADLSSAEYRRILQRFYGFYAPWETVLEPWARVCFGEEASARAKCPVLVRDLNALGVSWARLPHCTDLPDIAARAQALGSLYVREGATLGGQVISRHLETVLHLSGGCGYEFFRGYGSATGRMWRAFQNILSSATRPEEEQQVIDAAKDTFRCLHAWMREAIQ